MLNVLIPTTSIPSASKALSTPKSPSSRLGAAPRAGRKARRASNLAQLAEQAGASFFEGMSSRPINVAQLCHLAALEAVQLFLPSSFIKTHWAYQHQGMSTHWLIPMCIIAPLLQQLGCKINAVYRDYAVVTAFLMLLEQAYSNHEHVNVFLTRES